jgi:DNA-binding CsgD family transcriptional regulator
MKRPGIRLVSALLAASASLFGTVVAAHADTVPVRAARTAVVSADQSVQAKVAALLARSGVPAASQDRINALVAKLPADIDTRIAAATTPLLRDASDSTWTDIVNSVINPGDYQCSSTPVRDWLVHDLTLTDQLIYAILGPAPDPEPAVAESRPFGLTDREYEVLKLVGQGLTNAEIGRTLFISAKTVSVHVTSIMRKLGVSTRVQASTIAARTGILD